MSLAIRIVRAAVIFACVFHAGCKSQQEQSLVNFRHLEHLTEKITLEGRPVSIVHIYANYPDYGWVDAKESGPEGIACVDDAARAAVLYLRDYELYKHPGSLENARGLLNFVLSMQAPDGEFWNFIFQDHTINGDGRTSYKSFGWWAARGIWCLGLGCRVLKGVDPTYASRLGDAVDRSLPHIDTLLRNYGKTEAISGLTAPTWLLYSSGADATSELMMGLVEYFAVAPSPHLREQITRLAEGMVLMQDGDIAAPPFGMHRSWGSLWHMWGNSQTQALAMAGKALGDTMLVNSARREAEGFYTRLLVQGFMKEIDLADSGKSREFEQIAYFVRPMSVGLLRLYDVTGRVEYLRLAGLSASWLFGNNALGEPLYDSNTGRCFDGLRNKSEVNRNSGAESTIEALLTLVELQAYPEALRFSRYRKVQSDSLRAEFASPAGDRVTLQIKPQLREFTLQ
jgi:hypothetical protein